MLIANQPETAESKASLPIRWLELYGDGLYAYALRRVRRPEVAEDLLQETLLAGVQNWERFANRSNVRTWLTGILKNKMADYLRARYRNEKIESCSIDDDAMFDRRGRWKIAVPSWTHEPKHLAELAELRTVLNSCMSKLPTRMAHLFIRRATDQTSTSDLCVELRRSVLRMPGCFCTAPAPGFGNA